MSSIHHAGIWKTILQPSVRNGGVWKPAVSGWVKNGGVWKQFFTQLVGGTLFPPPTTRDIDVEVSGKGVISSGLTVGSDGSLSGPAYSGGNWFEPITAGIGATYYVRFSKVGSGNFSGSPLGTWLSLGSNRSISVATTTTVGGASGTITLEISRDGINPIASAAVNYTLARSL